MQITYYAEICRTDKADVFIIGQRNNQWGNFCSYVYYYGKHPEKDLNLPIALTRTTKLSKSGTNT